MLHNTGGISKRDSNMLTYVVKEEGVERTGYGSEGVFAQLEVALFDGCVQLGKDEKIPKEQSVN